MKVRAVSNLVVVVVQNCLDPFHGLWVLLGLREGPEKLWRLLLEGSKGSGDAPVDAFRGRSLEAMALVVGGVEGFLVNARMTKTL